MCVLAQITVTHLPVAVADAIHRDFTLSNRLPVVRLPKKAAVLHTIYYVGDIEVPCACGIVEEWDDADTPHYIIRADTRKVFEALLHRMLEHANLLTLRFVWVEGATMKKPSQIRKPMPLAGLMALVATTGLRDNVEYHVTK